MPVLDSPSFVLGFSIFLRLFFSAQNMKYKFIINKNGQRVSGNRASGQKKFCFSKFFSEKIFERNRFYFFLVGGCCGGGVGSEKSLN